MAHLACALTLLLSAHRAAAQTTGDTAGQAAPATGDDVLTMEAFDVEAEAVKGSAADLGKNRQKADVAIDFLSAEQLAKFSAGDAAEALIRIPGVSVAGGEFAVIRGLSDRYGNTLLNGLKVPSPDPEKQAVQLDLFPTKLLDTITVSKNFMPNLWGDTSGGSIDMGTRYLPEGREIEVSFGLKANSNALENEVPDYSTRGSNDFFGFGEDDRPGAGDRRAFQVVPDYRDAPLGNKFSLSYGDRLTFGENRILGFSAAVVQERGVTAKSGRKTDLTTRVKQSLPTQPSSMELGILLPAGDFGASDYTQSEFENSLGFLGGVGLQFSKEHQIGAAFMFSQSGIDTVEKKTLDPVNDPDLGAYSWYRESTYYRERNITAGQFRGDHFFPNTGDLKLEWVVQHAETSQHEPNFTEATYAMDASGQYVLSSQDRVPDPLERAWNNTDESQNTGRVDATLPFRLFTEKDSQFKFGAAAEKSKRTNTGYNEIYSRPTGTDMVADDPQDLFDQLLPGSPGASGTSSSDAERTLGAFYGMTSLELPAHLKLAGGLRIEQFEMTSIGLGSYGNTTAQDLLLLPGISDILGTNPGNLNAALDEEDLLPAAGLTWNPLPPVFVRLNYSQTVARPSFREVGSYFSQSFETGNLVLGNPALKPSEVHNYDLRLEWYFSANKADLLAVSVFSKTIKNPIEKMLFESATLGRFESWANNPGEAELQGFEVEARKSLSFLHESLDGFTIGGNYTRIDAEVPLHPTTISQLQNIVYLDPTLVPTTRRLFDQPEWIANVDLTYTHRSWGTQVVLSLFAISDVLTLPGSGFPPGFDLYEKGYQRLDLGISQKLGRHWTVKLGVKNLTDPARGLIYDPSLTNQEYARSTYRAGREYSLSATCKF
jgi:outer membrane receptor protein involved in Fe transport